MLINDRLSTFLPTVGAFRRRSMQVKWLQRSQVVRLSLQCYPSSRFYSVKTPPIEFLLIIRAVTNYPALMRLIFSGSLALANGIINNEKNII